MQTNSYSVVANSPKDVKFDCDVLMIESASGTVTIKTLTGTFTAEAGRVYRFNDLTKIQTITSTLSETVVLTYGFGLILFNPSWAGSGGGGGAVNATIVAPLNGVGEVLVGGPQPFGHVGGLADYDMPFAGNHLQALGPASTAPFVLQPNLGNGRDQYVGFTSSVDGFVHSVPDAIPLTDETFLRFEITTSAGTPIIISGSFGTPVALYTVDGRFISNGTYNVGDAPDNVFNVSCAGQLAINVAGNPAWGYRVTKSYAPYAPASPARASLQYYIQTIGVPATSGTLGGFLAGKKIKVYGYNFGSALPVDFQLVTSGGGVALTAKQYACVSSSEESNSPLFVLDSNLIINLVLSAPSPDCSLQLRYELE